MPSNVRQLAEKELEILSKTDSASAGYTTCLTYIGYLVSLPWNEKTSDNLDPERAEEILNKRHHGMQEVKREVLAYLSENIFLKNRKPCILVVDDEEPVRKNLAYILEKENYNVVTAASGLEALEKLDFTEFDVVLTDLKMEKVNGIEVLEKTKDRYPDTNVIIVTAYASVESAIEAIKREVFHYIEKPFRLDEIRSVVRLALEKKLPPVSAKGSILCFSGPPGTGKTSLGRSIAEALGRKFARISLGGMKDEAEIRGHRRTYAGAMPGRIIEEIRRAGSSNPVLMLDEADKIGQDFKGDPESALLEVLDPEQNQSFIDHYLDVPFDLSNVMFIVTTNNPDYMQKPLRDLMEIIEFPGYKENEKKKIALDYLVPQQILEQGLSDSPPEFTAEAISRIIQGYTREDGISALEQHIASVCRKIAAEYAHDKKSIRTVEVTPDLVEKYLGPNTYYLEGAGERSRIAIATGLMGNNRESKAIIVKPAIIKGLREKIENLFTEVTFAEAGEYDTGNVLLRKDERPQKVQNRLPGIKNRRAPTVLRRL